MAWALVDPLNLGEFFPDGDYVGWKEAVRQYYQTEMSEAEKLTLGVEKRLLYSQFSNKFCCDLGPLHPAECPAEYRTAKNYRAIASFIHLSDGLLAVDQAVKDLIEALEPGVHQFWPMRMTTPKGDPCPGIYFGMVVRRFLTSFRPELSDPSLFLDRGGHYMSLSASKKGYAGLAMSSAVIGSAHVWRERDLWNPELHMSDALQAGIAELGLRVPQHFRTMAV